MRATRTIVSALAAAAVALGIVGCTTVVDGLATPPTAISSTATDSSSSTSTSSASPSSSSEAAPSTSEDSGSAAPSEDSSGSGGGLTTFPADFPLPPGAESTTAANSALLTLPDPKGAYDFWIGALPAAGYTLGEKGAYGEGESFYGSITFSGNGVTTGTIAILGTTGAITVE